MKKKSVLIIHTGGTLGMGEPELRRLDLEPAVHLQRLLERVPELSEIADCDLVAPWNLDSSDVGPEHWQQLARAVVEHGRNGLLVAVRAAAPLADALEQLIREPDLRARMGAEGRRRALAEFSEDRIVADTLALYERLLN